jgi:hypothetical protein
VCDTNRTRHLPPSLMAEPGPPASRRIGDEGRVAGLAGGRGCSSDLREPACHVTLVGNFGGSSKGHGFRIGERIMMAWRRGRSTVRALMIANGLFTIATWLWVLWGRSAEYARKAEDFLERADFCRCNAARARDFSQFGAPKSLPVPDWTKERVKFFQVRADYAERLHRKYRRAAMFPWLSPEADPPEPTPSIWGSECRRL